MYYKTFGSLSAGIWETPVRANHLITNTETRRSAITVVAGKGTWLPSFFYYALIICVCLPVLEAQTQYQSKMTAFSDNQFANLFYNGVDGNVHWILMNVDMVNPSVSITSPANCGAASVIPEDCEAPAPDSALTGYLDQSSIKHVFYVGMDQNLYEVFSAPNCNLPNCKWVARQLSTFSRPFFPGIALTGFFDTVNSIGHVYYIDQNAHIRGLRNDGGNWDDDIDLTNKTNAPSPYPQSGLTSFEEVPSTKEHVFSFTPDGHVHELYNVDPKNDNTWQNSVPDLVATTQAPRAEGISALASHYDYSQGIQHVFYIDENQCVHELWHQGGWIQSCLTAKSGTQPAMKNSALASFYDGSGYQHLFYQSVYGNGDITWLSNANGPEWPGKDLTVNIGAPLANIPTSMTAYYDDVSVGRMFYVTPQGSIIEIYSASPSSPTSWKYRSLNNTPLAPARP